MKYCPFCGAGLQESMQFCPKCGKKFLDAEENPEATDNPSAESSVSTEPIISTEAHSEPVENSAPVLTSTVPKKSKGKLITTVVALVLIIGAVGVYAVSHKSVDIAEIANSVLYLEVYDDADNITATASGFVIEDGKTLVTNYHVIEDAYSITAWTPDGEQSVEIHDVLAYDETADLAILKCEENIGVPPLTLGDSDTVNQGDSIYAAGYPLGLAHTLSDGVVSSRYIDENNVDVIQITAAISSGSSGGALFNEDGQVIGVIGASYVDGQNLNLAISSNSLAFLFDKSYDLQAKSLGQLYLQNSTFGNTALNTVNNAFLAESTDYYYYIDRVNTGLYAYSKDTNHAMRIGDGHDINVYKNKLYYVDYDKNDVCCSDLDGKSKNFLGITNTDNHTNFSWSYDYVIGSMLLARNKLFLNIYENQKGNFQYSSLYVYDLESLELLLYLENTVGEFIYDGDILYIGLEPNTLCGINMSTLDITDYNTSCTPSIGGVDSSGKIYFTDLYNEFQKGIHILNPVTKEEFINSAVTGNDAGRGSGYDFFLLSDAIHICKTTFDLSQNLIAKNMIVSSNNNVTLWGNQSVPINYVNALSNNKYLYTSDGTTISAKTGEIVGTWVFG